MAPVPSTVKMICIVVVGRLIVSLWHIAANYEFFIGTDLIFQQVRWRWLQTVNDRMQDQ